MKIEIPDSESVSAAWEIPRGARALLTLAHGAGAGMHHPWLEALSQALHAYGVATLRYQFPYMEQGRKRTDPPAVATATVAAAVAKAKSLDTGLPIFAGGKSFGSRMTTTAAAQGMLTEIRGIVCFGFPLHPAKKPGVSRAAHLADVHVPTLFLQGTRDALAELDLLRPIVAKHRKWIQLDVIDDADHGFAVRKSSGQTAEGVFQRLAGATATFCREHANS